MEATFLLRLKAFLIDYLFILLYLGIVFASSFLFPSIQKLFTDYSLLTSQFFGFLIVTLPVSLYFIFCDSAVGKQTIGKRITGIQVVTSKNMAPPLPQSILRTILKFLPWELSHFLVYRLVFLENQEMPLHYYLIGGLIYGSIFTYILTAIFTNKKQSLYDLMARTFVKKIAR